MGLNGELKYIFIQLKIIFILTQHSFIKKIFKFRGGGMHTAAMQNTDAYRGGPGVCKWTVCMSVFLSAGSLYVGLLFGTEIVVIASWWQLDVGTVSYFELQDPEFQQLILIPSVLNLGL